MRSSLRAFLRLAALALALSACRIVVDTRLERDASGELRTAVVFSAEEAANFAAAPGNEGRSVCDQFGQNLPAGAAFAVEERAGETYCTTTRPFANLRELRQFYGELGSVTVNELKLEWARFTFDAQVDLTSSTGQGEPAPIEWRLTVPGTIQAHNADRLEGQTLIWDVAPGEVARLHVESSPGLSLATLGEPAAVALGCGLLLLAGIGAGFWLLRRRRSPAAKRPSPSTTR